MFKVGDKVRVVKKVEQENGWRNSWVDDMDELLGKTFTINMIDESGIFFEDSHYEFPPSSLELVTEEPQSVNQKRHKHADVIHAWAEGADIEVFNPNTCEWVHTDAHDFNRNYEYRIKPKEPDWWENIPEHGILVRRNHSRSIVVLVTEDIIDINTDPLDWTPLTNEEIERFKR